MERLTEKAPKPSVNSQYVKRKGFYTADCIERLGMYEDTDLTPLEIIELKERDTAKSPIDIEDNYGFFVCPSCGNSIYVSDDFESHKFCLNCGQRIKWED